MAGQQQHPRRREEEQPPPEDERGHDGAGGASDRVRDQEREQEVDDLLDEIDGVLEHNAEEFVHGFVQKGGQ